MSIFLNETTFGKLLTKLLFQNSVLRLEGLNLPSQDRDVRPQVLDLPFHQAVLRLQTVQLVLQSLQTSVSSEANGLELPLHESQTSLQGVHHDAGTAQQGGVVAAVEAGGSWRGAGNGAAVLAVGDGVGDGQQEPTVVVGCAGKRLVPRGLRTRIVS